LYGPLKLNAYRAADALVLPSLSEGFASVVLEAMASCLPVLITHNCHFHEVEAAGAGFVVSPTVDSLYDGLCKMLGLSDSQRVHMGRCGRNLIEQKYTWPPLVRQMVSVYQWLLDGGTPPPCVTLD
jgi:poly(glycerol-phosphate) alpha-glucosyltransferase